MSVTAVPIQPIARRKLVWLWLGILAAVAIGVGLAFAGTASTIAAKGTPEQFLAWNAGQPGVVTTDSGLPYRVLEEGEGAKPTDADVALVSYKGELRDGAVFDQNERAPMPVAQVVPGFSEALKLMSRKAKYRIWIPPALGYKDQETGPIPANSVLIFDVELIDFIPAAVLQQMQMQQMQGLPGGGAPGAPGGQ
jgi:hypothetical protein